MLKPGWKIGVSAPESVTLEDVVNHTDHICQIAGNAHHCGLGTDLDGGFGKEQSPHDLDTVAELPKLADILSRARLFSRRHRSHSVAELRGFLQ